MDGVLVPVVVTVATEPIAVTGTVVLETPAKDSTISDNVTTTLVPVENSEATSARSVSVLWFVKTIFAIGISTTLRTLNVIMPAKPGRIIK